MLTVTEAALLVLVVDFTFLTGSLGSISDPEPGLAHLVGDNVSLSHEGQEVEELLVFPAGQPPQPCCQLVLAPLLSVGVGQSCPVSCCPCGQEWA